MLANVPGLDEDVDAVLELHAQHARLAERIAAAEDEFIRRVAAAYKAGKLDWIGLIAAYDQVREWSKTNGLGTFVDRWAAHIGYDRNTLARYARSIPNSPDGTTWIGDTGWDSMGDSGYPPRGRPVAFVLFGNGKVPIHIGFTEQFRGRVKALHHSGLV
jgi:hypothetical protein